MKDNLTVVLALGSRLYNAPQPEHGHACCCGVDDSPPSRGKRGDSPWCYRHSMCWWSWGAAQKTRRAS